MPVPSSTPEVRDAPRRSAWVEPVIALVMAMATLSTAWCSYQSAAFTRRANRLADEASELERGAGLLSLQGMQTMTIHTALFMQMIAAQQAGNERLASFYVQRFPPDVRKAYDAWLAQKPLENPQAEPHPFTHSLYELRGSREAGEAKAKAAANVEEARKTGNVAGEYLANTVLFATVLFFATTAGKFEQRRVRVVSFIFAAAVFLFAIVRTAMLPL